LSAEGSLFAPYGHGGPRPLLHWSSCAPFASAVADTAAVFGAAFPPLQRNGGIALGPISPWTLARAPCSIGSCNVPAPTARTKRTSSAPNASATFAPTMSRSAICARGLSVTTAARRTNRTRCTRKNERSLPRLSPARPRDFVARTPVFRFLSPLVTNHSPLLSPLVLSSAVITVVTHRDRTRRRTPWTASAVNFFPPPPLR
jgi:hypothetical protein